MVRSFTHSMTSVASLKRPRYHERLFVDKMLKVEENKSILTTTRAAVRTLKSPHSLPCKGRKCFNFSKARTEKQTAIGAKRFGSIPSSPHLTNLFAILIPQLKAVGLSLIPSETVSDQNNTCQPCDNNYLFEQRLNYNAKNMLWVQS